MLSWAERSSRTRLVMTSVQHTCWPHRSMGFNLSSVVIKVADSWHDPYSVFEKSPDSDPHIIKYIGSELGRN